MDVDDDKLIAAVREAVREARELRAALASTRKVSGELRRQLRELAAWFRQAQVGMRCTCVATATITSGLRADWSAFAQVEVLRS